MTEQFVELSEWEPFQEQLQVLQQDQVDLLEVQVSKQVELIQPDFIRLVILISGLVTIAIQPLVLDDSFD